MKRIITFLVVWLGVLSIGLGQVDTNRLWFPVGEKLSYGLYWGIVPVGNAVFWSEWDMYEDRKVIVLKARAQTGNIVSKLYPVDDRIYTIVDPVTFKPIRYVQKLSEGRKERHDIIVFDYKKGEAQWTSGVKEKERKTLEIDGDTRDILSLVYVMREDGMGARAKRKFRVAVDEKVYDLTVNGQGYEKLKAGEFGRVRCLKVEPVAKFGEIFVRGGKVNLWFSDDSTRICTKMKAKVPLASVKALLLDISGPGNELWLKRKEKN